MIDEIRYNTEIYVEWNGVDCWGLTLLGQCLIPPLHSGGGLKLCKLAGINYNYVIFSGSNPHTGCFLLVLDWCLFSGSVPFVFLL